MGCLEEAGITGRETGLLELKNIEGETFHYQMDREILRELGGYSNQQEQTKEGFGFKWKRRDSYESLSMKNTVREWLLEKYFGGSEKEIKKIIPDHCRFLDAGCGAGLSVLSMLGERLNQIQYLGADISTAVDVAKERFKEQGVKGEFIQADLRHLPFDHPVFDVIFSEGVLHHTDSTKEAVQHLSKLLLQNGRFMFYVYAKKAVIREFCDDYIREYLKDKTDEQAGEELMPLTLLGKALGDLDIEVEIPQDITYLGIKKGRVNLQRLFYWNIFKAFYKPDFSLEEMNHINFDWYRPLNCHRHTPYEVEQWCAQAGLEIERLHVEEAGITVIAVKNS